jgi:hypothetical protein
MLAPENKDLPANLDLLANKALKENKDQLVLKDLPVIKDLRVPPGLLVVADRVPVLQKDTRQGFCRLTMRVDTSISTHVSNRKDRDA